jgi:hypothetical protein
LRCCPLSAFVIAHCHATANALVAGHFCRQSSSIACHCRCRCCWAATASTTTTVVKLAIVHCQRKRQQQQHYQRTNSSTNVKMFTSLYDLDLFNLSTVFEVCGDGLGNLAISNLLA